MTFALAAPVSASDYEGFFACPVLFSADSNTCEFPLHWLEQPLLTANPDLHDFPEQQCENLLAPMRDQYQLSNRIRRLLLEHTGTYPDITIAAQQFNLSERTLRRRLALENTTYKRLCDQVTEQLAIQYLEHSALPATEISGLLGFSDSANFRRACNRWFGVSPSRYRELARGPCKPASPQRSHCR